MKTIVVLSGGMDSAVLLWYLRDKGYDIETVSIDYGQRHRKEIICAKDLAIKAKVKHDVIDLTSLGALLKGSSQSDLSVPVPFGRYDEPSMKLTVVPNRNMVLLASVGAVAIARKAECIAYGAHAGDHTIYPDCRPEFVNSMRQAFNLADWHSIGILAPFIDMSKGEICLIGAKLSVPFELTWTCYMGDSRPCGKCGSCVERAEAFAFAGIPDPLEVNKCGP